MNLDVTVNAHYSSPTANTKDAPAQQHVRTTRSLGPASHG
jgi:hypothetical protein